MKHVATIVCLALFLSACSNKGPAAPTEGRQSIAFVRTASPVKAATHMNLGEASDQKVWPMAFGNAANYRAAVRLSPDLKLVRTVSLGEGVDSDAVTIASPVISNGLVYTLDSSFVLQITDLVSGRLVRRVKLPKVLGTTAKSIGLAVDGNRLYAVAGNGLIVAVSIPDGTVVWQKELNAPLRSSPVVRNGRLFVSSVNNDLFALKTLDGDELWRYEGEPTVTNFFGMGTPAVDGSVVVMPTTTGRVNAFDVETGVLIWTETMWTARTFNPFWDLTHVTASPVIENGVVYVVGNAGKTGAYRLANGRSVFDVEIGGRETPVLSGDVLFMISNQNELTALDKKSGRVYWKTLLSGTDKNAIWKGPLLVNDLAVVVSSVGEMVFFDLKSGQEVRRDKQDALFGVPVAAGGFMVLTTNDGDMLFYQ